MVRRVLDPVHHRVAHVDIGRRHVDLCAERASAVRELALLHPPEQIEILGHAAVAIRTILARLAQGAPMRANLLGRQIAHVRLAPFNELDCPIVELLKVIRCVEQPIFPIAAEPTHVINNRIDVFLLFLRRVRVVEPQVELAGKLLRKTEVQADALRMPDMQIPVWLRRKPRMYTSTVFAGGTVGIDDLLDEVARRFVVGRTAFFRRVFGGHVLRASAVSSL